MDRLGLDDWHSSSASDSSHDSSGIHLITEEDLLDSLFFTCDVNKNRKVPVSKLIETLKFTTGLTNEDPPHDHLEDLCRLLDPEGRDVHVNLSTYRKAMSLWIQTVRQKNCFESPEEIGDDFPNFFMPERALSPEYDKIVQYLKMPFGSSSPGPVNDIFESGETVGTTYLEGSGCGGMEEAPVQEADMVEILNRVTTLQLSNQKLAEENSKLRSERESADDLMLQTNQEVEQLKKTIKSHQVTVDRMCELRKENDDLKEMVESLEALRRASEMKHGDLHKENRTLEQDITELQVELHEVSSQLTLALEEQSSLHSSFVEQKQKRTEAEKLRHLQMTQLLEKSSQLEQLQTIISDLGRKNEYIREEKTNLEQQLTQTQQQLSTMQARVGQLGVVETSDEESDSEELMPIKLIPVASSTPCHGLSIGLEMKTSIVDDPMLPSPLCDKEFEEMLKECQPGEVERSVDGIALSHSVAQKYGAKAFTAADQPTSYIVDYSLHHSTNK
ncbi:Lymphoid-restricted membrane protein [Lamellibrachia satsuma]|nr:Lymphoid-restricted membrane protein [Lamellibrachia satsuma]